MCKNDFALMPYLLSSLNNGTSNIREFNDLVLDLIFGAI